MKIIEYTEEWKEKWDNFVLESNNGTIFHLQKFFDYHPKDRFSFNHLIFLNKDNIVAVLPGSRTVRCDRTPHAVLQNRQ